MVSINEMAEAYIQSVELDIQKISEQIESLQSNLNAAFVHLDECKEALVESNSCSANGCKSSGGEKESTGHTEQSSHGVVGQADTLKLDQTF